MRLLGQISRKYGEMEYKKHWIILPNKIVKILGWRIGEELEFEVKDKKLVIEKD